MSDHHSPEERGPSPRDATMNTDVLPSNGAFPDADNSNEKSSPYDDFLPASYRTSNDDIACSTVTTSLLQKEFQVKRLNEIHKWLWMVGQPMPPRPLHYQKAVGRNIVVHEQADLHLVWDEQRIFLKPIPGYLLNHNFWRDILSCNNGCESTSHRKPSRDPPPHRSQDPENQKCATCRLRALTTGFLYTYTALLSHESDFHIAQSHNLIPSSFTWPQWRAFVKYLLSSSNNKDMHTINLRYHYGELRLSRLNIIYILTLRAPLRGYLYGYNTYHSFWSTNTKRVAAGFAYLALVLTAMQVGLATEKLGKSDAFQRASWGFAVFSIVAPLGLLGLVLGVFLGVFVVNWVWTRKYLRRRMRWIGRGGMEGWSLDGWDCAKTDEETEGRNGA